MTNSFPNAPDGRRGVALVMVLAAVLLVTSLSLFALRSAVVLARLSGDNRWRVEAALVAASALAEARLSGRDVLDTLTDGVTWIAPVVARPDGWSWLAAAVRRGAVIRLVATAERFGADGTLLAARRASLLLIRDAADTVRVIGRQARF